MVLLMQTWYKTTLAGFRGSRPGLTQNDLCEMEWESFFFLIAPFPYRCLLVPLYSHSSRLDA